MKKLVVLLFLAGLARAEVEGPSVSLGGDVPAPAVAPITVDPVTPATLQRIADGLHLADNVTGATFYDVNNGVWLAGGITTLYKKYYISLDAGLASVMTANAQGEFVGGARFHMGEFLFDKIPGIQAMIPTAALRAGLLKYSAIGTFYSRDWTDHLNRYGAYAGIEYRFF